MGSRMGGSASAPSAPSQTTGRRGGYQLTATDTHYLWLLLALEVFATVVLRHWSRNHHGG